MKQFILFLSLITLVACKNNENDAENNGTEKVVEDYEKVEGNSYRSFYGGNDQIKMEGMYDDAGEKHGVWTYYFPDGRKQSVTEYKNGLKDVNEIVPNHNARKNEGKTNPKGVRDFGADDDVKCFGRSHFNAVRISRTR